MECKGNCGENGGIANRTAEYKIYFSIISQRYSSLTTVQIPALLYVAIVLPDRETVRIAEKRGTA